MVAPTTLTTQQQALLQIFAHVAALYEPVRKPEDFDLWRSVMYHRWRYPTHGVRLTSVMAGVKNRAHFADAIRRLKSEGLISELKSAATKLGNSFQLTPLGLDVACVICGIYTVMDSEDLVAAVAYHQVEHEPKCPHTWVNERAILQHMDMHDMGTLQSALLPACIAGLVANSSDLLGRASYRIPDRVMEWMRQKSELYFESQKPATTRKTSSIFELAEELGIKLVVVDDHDGPSIPTTPLGVYLQCRFTLDGLDDYERVPDERRPSLDIDLWPLVDRAKENIRAAAASMPAGELGAIPLIAHGAPSINYGTFDEYPDLYYRDYKAEAEARAKAARDHEGAA